MFTALAVGVTLLAGAVVGQPYPCADLPGSYAQVGCGVASGLTWQDGGTSVVSPNNAAAGTGNGDNHGFCTADGTLAGTNTIAGDGLCGNITFLFECWNRASNVTNVQMILNGQAQTRNGNDDSVYVFLDNRTDLIATAHTGFQVNTWRNSGGILTAQMNPITNGLHTVTIREREDGTIIRGIRIVAGQGQCRFLQASSTMMNVAPTCHSPLPTAASVGCADIQGYSYVASEDYVVGAQLAVNGGCSPTGVFNGPPDRVDDVCGNVTWQFACWQNTTVNFAINGRAERANGNDDSVYAMLDGDRSAIATVHTGWNTARFQYSPPVFGPTGGRNVTAGVTHTITLMEREDGAAIQNLSFTLGSNVCSFITPTPAPTPAPTSPLLPNVTQLQSSVSTMMDAQTNMSQALSTGLSNVLAGVNSVAATVTDLSNSVSGSNTDLSNAIAGVSTAVSSQSNLLNQVSSIAVASDNSADLLTLSQAVSSLTASITNAVSAVPNMATSTPPLGNSPAISTSSNTMLISGDGRAVKMATTCGSEVDPCDMLRALNQLKNL